MSELQKRKISESKIGKPSPKKGKPGKPHTPEQKLKTSISLLLTNAAKRRERFITEVLAELDS